MKACPICQSTYEDWIEFCFNDGVPLVAHEPNEAAARPSAPRPSSSRASSASTSLNPSSYDAPEARLVSGIDLPEPAHLPRFAAPAPVAASPAPPTEPDPQPIEPFDTPIAPAPPQQPVDSPVAERAAEPGQTAASEGLEAPPAPALTVPALPESNNPRSTLVPDFSAREDRSPPTPTPTEFDADAMSDLASAFGAPTAGGLAGMAAGPAPFHAPPRPESDNARPPVLMYTANIDDTPEGRSALDDDPPLKKRAVAGIGVVLLGVFALGAFLVIAAVGLWWTMSNRSDPAVTSVEPTPVEVAKVLPAAADPAPAELSAEALPATDATGTPLPDQAGAAPVVTTTTTTASVSRPPSTPKATSTTNGATAPSPRSSAPSGRRTSTPAPAPEAAAPPGAATSVTSDSLWGTPSAPTSGLLRIVTDPDGATVYVNEAGKGKTPVTIELPYGAHQVRVVRAGYKTEVRDVNIRVRELTVPFNLKPEVVTGQVNVYGPDGFRVVVDGHDMGPMPVTVQVSEGLRQFKLIGPSGNTCNLPREINFKTIGRPETVTLACP